MRKRITVTATKKGLTHAQIAAAYVIFSGIEELELHHGGCIGGDAQLHRLARQHADAIIVCHRGHTPEYWDYWDDTEPPDQELDSKDNILRNHDMVTIGDEVLAFPSGKDDVLRSGTWATIRYTRRVRKKLTIIFPDGTTE